MRWALHKSGAGRSVRRVRPVRITKAAHAWAAIRKDSVVNKYGQTWDHSNLFLVGSSTFPTMGTGFNPTLTIQALAYMTADAIVNRYRKNPGPLI